ncbi:hypothetical protein [Mycobacterium sp. DL592]|uniref:hypothetical protein n=1 Tax=Mycobacterium sp. DL592 TaxID=2675524 RepID=UPI00141EDBAA|nr:hypothetical protein [Mycobacterium sp. DL592]
MRRLLDLGIGLTLLVSAAAHGYLYLHGYRHLPMVGIGFLVLTSAFVSLAVLIALGGPRWLHAAAVAGSLAAIVAFALSRTVGLLGFVEHGWQPAPYAAISVGAEVLTVVLGAVALGRRRHRRVALLPTG